MAPHFAFASPKPSVAMVVYNPGATAQRLVLKRGREEDEAEASSTAGKRVRREDPASAASSSGLSADSIVLDVEPINAVPPPRVVFDVKPINAVAPPPFVLAVKPITAFAPRRQPLPQATARELPPCVREHFLRALGLRADLAVHFIAEKVVTSTDVDGHQNRFRIPLGGVESCLRAILTPDELDAANLLHDAAPRRRRPPKKTATTEPGKEEEEGINKTKEPKKKGKVHGGLRVRLVDLAAGVKELEMSRWDSSRATVIKGEGYIDFIRRCSFGEGDTVEIWTFLQRPVRIFGIDVQRGDGVLHVLIAKKHQQRCCFCPFPHAQ